MARRVLVVEVNEPFRVLISVMLRLRGYEVLAVETGLEALAAARSGTDIVLLDVGLPGLNGLEVCRRLRSDPATAALPVVLLTGRAEPGDIRDGLRAGADDVLIKPLEEAELLLRLDRAGRP
jgi:two-component system cell cycle response regulator